MLTPEWLNTLDTPFLLIDESKYLRNVQRLYSRIEALGSEVRPHLKTLRSPESARHLLKTSQSPATVSTLAEAEAFAKAGYTNLLYGVGVSPQKLPCIAALMQQGVVVHILLDNTEQARAVTEYGKTHNLRFSVFIEVDCDGHRGGLPPDSDALLALAKAIDGHGATLTGLLTHAGESYSCTSDEQLRAAAKAECDAIRVAGERVRRQGHLCPILSVGSTPTAHFVEDLTDITEVRAGVFTAFDLVMKNIGVCEIDDIAMSVVATVIGHNAAKGWVFIDAGWMALSRDRGTASQAKDYGYGQLCDLAGQPYDGLMVNSTNQEHGIVVLSPGYRIEDFPVGQRVRILPNHACATAAMHQQYDVMSQGTQAHKVWSRIVGW